MEGSCCRLTEDDAEGVAHGVDKDPETCLPLTTYTCCAEGE